MKKGWKYGILDNVVYKGSSNISLNKIQNDDGEYPVFGAKGFAKNISFFQQDKEYLAIIKDGAGIGRVSKHPAKSSVLATLQYIIPKDGFNIDFIRYFLESLDFETYRTGSTIPHIYYKDYKKAIFPLLESSEQKQIVAILDKAFTAIDQAKTNIERNIANAKELFQSKLNDIFSQKGDGWVEKSLIQISKFIDYRGKTPQKTDSGIKLITAKNVKMGFLKNEPEEFIAAEDYDGWMTRGIPIKGDVLFTTEAPLANVTLLNTDDKIALAQRIITICPNREVLSGEYLSYCLQSGVIQDRILEKGTGATVTGIKSKVLKEIIIPIPLLKKQVDIVKTLDNISAETKKLEVIYQQKLTNLEELKKSILQKAFKGELV